MPSRDVPMDLDPGWLDDVLARVLDRGIVIDAESGWSLLGLSLAGGDAQFVIASIDTQRRWPPAGWIGGTPSLSGREEIPRPASEPGEADPGRRPSTRPRGHGFDQA